MSDHQERTTKRLAELEEIIPYVEIDRAFYKGLRMCHNQSSPLAAMLNKQLCAAHAYIGELHREIDDLKELQKVRHENE